jgi:predicted aldo/keto reductase-like oxidoreductase
MTYAVSYTVHHFTTTGEPQIENIVLSGMNTREDVTQALTYSYQFGPITNVTITSY